MATNRKYAVIIVDLLNDFVTGVLACDRAQNIIEPTQRLLQAARRNNVPVIFSNDAHYKGVDFELKLWGDHAIKGTPGAQVIPEVPVEPTDFVVEKRRYSGFFHTDLDLLLEELKVTDVIITGLHTHMCVRHTSADAFQLGYSVTIPQDATDAFTEEDYKSGLKYLKDTYGATVTDVATLSAEFDRS